MLLFPLPFTQRTALSYFDFVTEISSCSVGLAIFTANYWLYSKFPSVQGQHFVLMCSEWSGWRDLGGKEGIVNKHHQPRLLQGHRKGVKGTNSSETVLVSIFLV